MPTYQYRCTQCACDLEVVQRFTDDPLTACPQCEGSLRKVYSAVGVVFKGSGFYATDARAAAGKAKPAAATGVAKPAEHSSDVTSAGTTPATPAKAAASKPAAKAQAGAPTA